MLYRVTIPSFYKPGTPGHSDPGSRQGHYVDAESVTEAKSKIKTRLSAAIGEDFAEDLEVQDWSGGEHHTYVLSEAGMPRWKVGTR